MVFYYSYYTNIHLPPAFPVVVIIMDVSVELFIICLTILLLVLLYPKVKLYFPNKQENMKKNYQEINIKD